VLPVSAALAGCGRPFHPSQVPKTKVLIAEFDVGPGIAENPRAIRGWWMGSENIYQSRQYGGIFAERLSAHLARYSYIKLYSRLDLKYYIAPKREMLKDAYPQLSDREVNALLAEIPDLDFARELRADKLLRGRLVENHLHENRTFNWWKSIVHVECELVDVETGRVEWSRDYRRKGRFASPLTVQDEIARQVGRDLEQDYFRHLTLDPVLR
jgi:hypothetical protein